MNYETFSRVDDYLAAQVVGADAVLEAALAASDAAGLPPIQVSANQGKLLQILALSIGAKSILEIGTLGGYSTICLARALPSDGHLTTLELDLAHATVATANVKKAGLGDKVTVRLGAALDTLALLEKEGAGPFDFVFIDADKANIPHYYAYALKLTHPGSIIIVDNVVRGGEVAREDSDDPNVQGVRAFLAGLHADARVTASALQTVGSKGYDGFAVLRVN